MRATPAACQSDPFSEEIRGSIRGVFGPAPVGGSCLGIPRRRAASRTGRPLNWRQSAPQRSSAPAVPASALAPSPERGPPPLALESGSLELRNHGGEDVQLQPPRWASSVDALTNGMNPMPGACNSSSSMNQVPEILRIRSNRQQTRTSKRRRRAPSKLIEGRTTVLPAETPSSTYSSAVQPRRSTYDRSSVSWFSTCWSSVETRA